MAARALLDLVGRMPRCSNTISMAMDDSACADTSPVMRPLPEKNTKRASPPDLRISTDGLRAAQHPIPAHATLGQVSGCQADRAL
jgi:hypothetical protein